MHDKLKSLLIEVAELNDEEAQKATNTILAKVQGEMGSDQWLKTVTQSLANELTSRHVDTPGLKIGEIIRKLQK